MASSWHRPADGDAWIMGVLNCTPDSFSDGGNFFNTDTAIQHGMAMRDAGAAIIDVGGESTRPGAVPVSEADELARVIPVISGLARAGCTVSVDTMKAAVMRQAVAAGATIINDVSALSHDPEALQTAAACNVDLCLMHMQGTPATMQERPRYDRVVDEVSHYFERRIEACIAAGIREESIILDPGIGFGKRLEDNLQLIAATGLFKQRFDQPLLLGVSRKSFIGLITGAPVEDREIETAAVDAVGILLGADIVRVHDPLIQGRAARTASALRMAHESLARSGDTTMLASTREA